MCQTRALVLSRLLRAVVKIVLMRFASFAGSDIEGRPDAGYESDPEEEKETAEQKKLRLAKAYLEEIEKEGS